MSLKWTLRLNLYLNITQHYRHLNNTALFMCVCHTHTLTQNTHTSVSVSTTNVSEQTFKGEKCMCFVRFSVLFSNLTSAWLNLKHLIRIHQANSDHIPQSTDMPLQKYHLFCSCVADPLLRLDFEAAKLWPNGTNRFNENRTWRENKQCLVSLKAQERIHKHVLSVPYKTSRSTLHCSY